MQQIHFRNLSKSYGYFAALSSVALDLDTGQTHALMGENGAGKSTLIKLIAGVVKADSMNIAVDGVAFDVSTPKQAFEAGFRFIHQELNIVPQLSVAENILLGRDYPLRLGLTINWRVLRRRAREALELLGVQHIDVSVQAGSLSSGDRMLVNIASALVADEGEDVRLYVLDEPTAALTGPESEKLFNVIEQLKHQGAAILYVSHRLNEVLRICDHVSVLRDGLLALSSPIQQTSRQAIIAAMTGRDVVDAYPPPIEPPASTTACCATNVCSARLSNIDFSVKDGEILGIAGLAEAGQSEVLQLFMGLEAPTQGALTLHDQPAPQSPSEAWARGVAYIPKERRAQALMLCRSIRDNTVLPHLSQFGALANKAAESEFSRTHSETVRLKSSGVSQVVSELSGGNQQKVIFARALGGKPELLLLDEPTRGVDVGAKFDIYALVRQLSAKGCSVILTSSDLPELLGMCDRLLILRDGKQVDIVDCKGLDAGALLDKFYE